MMDILSLTKFSQIICIACFSQSLDRSLKLRFVHPAFVERDFLQACDFEALMLLDGMNELGCL
jgi:hypothetical protein